MNFGINTVQRFYSAHFVQLDFINVSNSIDWEWVENHFEFTEATYFRTHFIKNVFVLFLTICRQLFDKKHCSSLTSFQ